MPVPTNPQLIDAMTALTANDTPENRHALYAALLDSTFLLPTTHPLTGGNGTSHDLTMDTLVTDTHDGQLMLFVFTDADALRQWQPEDSPCIVLSASDTFQLALKYQVGSIQINPSSAVGGSITAGEITALARGVSPGSTDDVQVHQQAVQSDTQVMLGAPSKPLPIKVAAQLQRSLAAHPIVAACYVFMLAMGSDSPQQIAGIVFYPQADDATKDAIMRQITSEVTAVLKPNRQLAFMVLQGDMLHNVRGTVHPAYRRT